MAITFAKGGMNTLTLERGRVYPLSRPIDINQELNLTDGMNPKVTDYGGTAKYWQLVFNYLSKDNFDGAINGLKTWFESATINWCANSFTMTDERGAAIVVRLWQKRFDMSEHGSSRFGISLTLIEGQNAHLTC